MNASCESYFSRQLLEWNLGSNNRIMPWKSEKNPYFIWLSEVILQQTRVDQGLSYYKKFVKKYPTVEKLACAKELDVFKLWEGLGYYNRCRNLMKTATIITEKYNGKFPKTYAELLELPGVGPYTAAAISSFAFNAPYSVLDGNVFRVLARFFGVKTPIDTAVGKKYFTKLADVLLPENSAIYNQAIMDFGATVCVPANPNCDDCPLQIKCKAYQQNMVASLPVKEKKLIRQDRFFHYLVVESKGKVLLQKRTGKDVWKDLYQFPLVEVERINAKPNFKSFGKDMKATQLSLKFKQSLTHQTIHASFHRSFSILNKPPDSVWVKISEISSYPFPKIILQFLKNEFAVD